MTVNRKTITALLAVAFIALVVFVTAHAIQPSGPAPQDPFFDGFDRTVRHESPPPYPEGILYDLDDRTHDLKDYRGRMVLVNFWALWCPPCLEELPSLVRLQKDFRGGAMEIVLVSMDYLEDGAALRQKMAQRDVIAPDTLYAKDTALMKIAGTGLPATLILNRRGEIIYTLTGDADWDSLAARRALGSLIAE